MRTSENPLMAKFREFALGEIRGIHLPRTPVNKGMKKGRDPQEPRLFHLALELSLCVLA